MRGKFSSDDKTTYTTMEAPAAASVPPLPPDIKERILSHLLPPTPLPAELLSEALIARLTFLPPDPDDLDAFLSPQSARIAAPLARLAHSSPGISDTEYAHDGEMTIARFTIGDEADDDRVTAYMQHEERGWMFRGGEGGKADPFDWKSDVREVEVYEESGDYWAGYSSVSDGVSGETENDEDDYWAQYGAGEHQEEAEHQNDKESPDPLSMLGQSEEAPQDKEAQDKEAQDKEAQDKTTTTTPHLLDQKIRGKVRAQLTRAWSCFSEGEDAEASGYDWLRIGREIADRQWGSNESRGDDTRTAVVKARIESAKDIHDALGDEDGSFWRLVEEAIRSYTSPVQEEVPLF